MEPNESSQNHSPTKEFGERKSLRVRVYLDVRCDLASGATVKGKIVNLGTAGVCVQTGDPVAVRQNLSMEFLLPNTLSSVQLEGKVAWVRLDHEAGTAHDRPTRRTER